MEQNIFDFVKEQVNARELVKSILGEPPVKSGETALKELKELDGFSTPVIALTADAIAGSEERYLEEGFTDYIAKPFTKDQIKIKLEKVFKKAKEKEEIL